MPKLAMKAGSTSQTVDIFIQDATATDGSGKTGLVYNTSGLTAYYNFPGGSSTAITLATLAAADSSWSSGGFKEIDSTNQKGHYRFDVPDALLASGNGRSVKIVFQGTGIVPCPLEIELTGWDNQDGVHGGFSCLPNTAVATNGSLLTSGTGTSQITVSSGAVTVGTNDDKTGYELSSTGADSLSTTVPSGYASTLVGRINQLYNLFLGKSSKDSSNIKSYDPTSLSTAITTQAYTDDGVGNQTRSKTS